MPDGMGVMLADGENSAYYRGPWQGGEPYGAAGTMYWQNFSGKPEMKFCLRKYYGGVQGWGVMEGWGVEYHVNGKVKNRGRFRGGIAVGKCVKLYWENGALKFVGEIDEALKCNGVCFSKTGRRGALITGGVGVLDL